MQERKLTIADLACYLPYGLQTDKGLLWAICNDSLAKTKLNDGEKVKGQLCDFKPLLRPLSQLTQVIVHDGHELKFIELFEIGDEGGYNYEFDHGNVKLIEHLKTIASHDLYHDIAYLPYQVVCEMHRFHFDTTGLLLAGLAIEKPAR